jgi:transposase
MRPHGSPSVLEKRRHKAIELSHKGKQTIEIAHIVGATRRTIRRWKALYRQKGIRGLEAVPAPGRPIRLSIEQRDELEQILMQGARVAGYDTDLWTCPRVVEVIRHQFGVRYHVDHIGRLLHSLGWSPQRPQRRAMERDEQKVRSWIKGTWVRIKKNEKASSTSRIPR